MSFNLSRTQKEYAGVFFCAAAIVFGNAYLVLVNHDASFSSDEASYLALGNGSWDVNITHRYRVIVPFLARGLALLMQQMGALAGMEMAVLPLGFAFFVVNSTIMALAGTVIYGIAKAAGTTFGGRFMAVLAVLTSGYCSYFCGIALVDSLYFLALALLFYGLLARNETMLFAALLLGPLAKESFWLFLPFVLLFGRFISFHRLVFYLVLAACVFMAANNLVDHASGLGTEKRMSNAVGHLHNAWLTFQRLFTVGGFMAWFGAFGLFNFLVLAGWLTRRLKLNIRQRLTQMQILFLLIVGAHILLSGDIGRMWYFAAPVFALAVAFTTDRLLSSAFGATGKQLHPNENAVPDQFRS